MYLSVYLSIYLSLSLSLSLSIYIYIYIYIHNAYIYLFGSWPECPARGIGGRSGLRPSGCRPAD